MITANANIYVSAIQFGGNPQRVLQQVIDGDIQIAISQPILDEVLRILRAKFGRSSAELAKIEALISGFTQMVTPTQTLNVVTEDPDDNRIIERAVASDSDIIVTGEKDLLRRGNIRASRFLRPHSFCKKVRAETAA